MEQPRVFLVDDDASVRKGLTRLLRSVGYEIEAFESAEAFLKREPYAGIACLLLDLRMPGITGSELQQRLENIDPELPVVFVSGHAGVPDSVQAMKRGAVDFLTKPVDEAVLLAAIDGALDRRRQWLASNAETRVIRQRVEMLSARELEAAQWIITGRLNKQIAVELGITEKTVKAHRARVLEKMGVTSVVELARLCAIAGVEPKSPRR